MQNIIDVKTFEPKAFSTENKNLPGFLSAQTTFTWSDTLYNGFESYKDPRNNNIANYIPEESDIKKVGDIFIGKEGAVSTAYNLDSYSTKEHESIIWALLTANELKYPGYKFVLLPEKFPIGIKPGHYGDKSTLLIKGIPVFLTHILYITNYKEFVEDNKRMRKKL